MLWHENPIVITLAGQFLMVLTLGLYLHFGYQSGFVAEKDVPMLLVYLLSNAGLGKLEKVVQRRRDMHDE